ncbi:hypothetical protein Lesp02_80480 [Lentzea sp. NBRC 105346]|uniref:hypothetical protein n=1 Tax=Lentzea sp. NBRC 105346 TaxID=3032205 RepID=UPI0024A54E50|nr:hypothetical protein [Lentzea sp. NBRC 105346]GLZ35861.1 hypothetical protein Lesp02_80480 [Lentzea sp. NBRC 105346]
MDTSHVGTLASARETHRAVVSLLADAARRSSFRPETDVRWNPEDHGIYWVLFSNAGTWAEPLDGWVELCIADRDDWTSQRRGVPAIGAGIALDEAYYEEVRSSRLKAWRQALGAGGVEVQVFDRYVRVWSTKYFSELPRREQPAHLASWLDETMAFLARHDPGLTGPAEPGGGERSGEPLGRRSHGLRGLD